MPSLFLKRRTEQHGIIKANCAVSIVFRRKFRRNLLSEFEVSGLSIHFPIWAILGSEETTPIAPCFYRREDTFQSGSSLRCRPICKTKGFTLSYPYTFMHKNFGLTTGGPDLCSVGKTIGNCFVAFSGVLVSQVVKDTFINGSDYIPFGQTYHSHDFNCSVGLAVQQKILRENMIENVSVSGEDSMIAGDVRGAGNFMSIEIVADRPTKEPFPASVEVGPTLTDKSFEKGMTTMGLSGTLYSKLAEDGSVVMVGDHISTAPAYTFTKEDCDFIRKTLVESIYEFEKERFA